MPNWCWENACRDEPAPDNATELEAESSEETVSMVTFVAVVAILVVVLLCAVVYFLYTSSDTSEKDVEHGSSEDEYAKRLPTTTKEDVELTHIADVPSHVS